MEGEREEEEAQPDDEAWLHEIREARARDENEGREREREGEKKREREMTGAARAQPASFLGARPH